jgi:hypothetical protein
MSKDYLLDDLPARQVPGFNSREELAVPSRIESIYLPRFVATSGLKPLTFYGSVSA